MTKRKTITHRERNLMSEIQNLRVDLRLLARESQVHRDLYLRAHHQMGDMEFKLELLKRERDELQLEVRSLKNALNKEGLAEEEWKS